jgi:hypothetical protein
MEHVESFECFEQELKCARKPAVSSLIGRVRYARTKREHGFNMYQLYTSRLRLVQTCNSIRIRHQSLLLQYSAWT